MPTRRIYCAMSALDQDCRPTQGQEAPRRVDHGCAAVDAHPGEGLGLGDVGGRQRDAAKSSSPREPGRERLRGERRAEQEALTDVAATSGQEPALRLGLDPLGDDA